MSIEIIYEKHNWCGICGKKAFLSTVGHFNLGEVYLPVAPCHLDSCVVSGL